MKKLSLILAVLMLAALCAMPISAAPADVLIGTPELDGEIDEIYYQSGSFTVTTANQVHKSGAEYTDAPEFEATTYFLYDDEYIYMATEVTDATITKTNKDPAAAYVWQNDVVEHWISLDGGATWGQFNYDAHDTAIGIGLAAPFVSKDLCEGAATIVDDDTYVVEVKFPHQGNTTKVCVTPQVNNIMVADGSKIVCIGGQKKAEYALNLTDEEVEIIVEEEAPAEAPAAAATADVVTLAVAALVLSGAGVVVSKKNRK